MKRRTWILGSVALLLTAMVAWRVAVRHDEGARRTSEPTGAAAPARPTAAAPPAAAWGPLLTRLDPLGRSSGAADAASSGQGVARSEAAAPGASSLRLSNTSKPVKDLMQSESAILLQNAFIDTANGEQLRMPAHLRSQTDPEAYIVQAYGPVNEAFRAELAAAKAAIVAYIPNNAYLVRLSQEGAQHLSGRPPVQAVLAYEPYYKLAKALLELAVAQAPLAEGAWLTVLGFPGEKERALADLQALGAEVKGEGKSPFGPQFVVAPAPGSLVALANLSSLQLLEPYQRRVPLNDVTRVRLGVAEDLVAETNYLGLSGSNVWVNVNDTGVWGEHPDLRPRVYGGETNYLVDLNGHGTHVAGTIASSGEHSPDGTNAPPPPGSPTNANFRGVAPLAKLMVLPIDLETGPVISDSYLQETAAQTNYHVLERTNALISNNSWGYLHEYEYNAAAASYDAAVRDALPDEPGSQAMVYIFAAGNEGRGNDVGTGGEPGSIVSPATAKNVITVGAIENLRNLSYEVLTTNWFTNEVDGKTEITNQVVTNTVILPDTDSHDQVANFSSRGNVGLGTEGRAGRFKPDLVAPGTFIVSTRPTNWEVNPNPVFRRLTTFPGQVVAPSYTNHYYIFVPTNAITLRIELLTNLVSPTPWPDLPIYARYGTNLPPPDFTRTNTLVLSTNTNPLIRAGLWYYGVGNTNSFPVSFDLMTTLELTNVYGSYYTILSNLNARLRPYYGYDSGSSASAAAVSGLVALLQEFFEQRLELPYTPALLKAVLINGARTVSPMYDFQVRNLINYQGWGLPNLPFSLPSIMNDSTNQTDWPLQFVDQSSTNALATGHTHTYLLGISTNATHADLRVTLVWTDPPGNPSAAIKLVNDLNLVVSNKVTGAVYTGNDIAAGSDYNSMTETNQARLYDDINNVENVFIRRPVGTNYAIYVTGQRVNVNAVTAHTNGVVQDYALVVSLADATLTNALTLGQTNLVTSNAPQATTVTNGLPLLHERVGANSPLQGGPNGVTNQWHFYRFINSARYSLGGMTNGPYVAFVTFMPPNLSLPRTNDADIDLFVTRGDAGLLQLDPASVQRAYKSLKRGGTELVTFTNATIGETFYIGVKAEDQMASEYGFVALSSDRPFEQMDENGTRFLQGLPPRVIIPDGSPSMPEAALMFAIGITPGEVSRAVVSNTIFHSNLGDLLGNLSHERQFVVLNNHKILNNASGLYPFVYDDSGAGDFPNATATDGPGTLNNFIGEEASGVWLLSMVDNTLGHTGVVEGLSLRIEPNPDLTMGVWGSVAPGRFRYYSIDIPPDATNLTVSLAQMSGPLELYVRRGLLPTLTGYDKRAAISPPGGSLTLGLFDLPPLRAGRYFIGVYNPTAATATYRLFVRVDRDVGGAPSRYFVSTVQPKLLDDARTASSIFVPDARPIVGMEVGVRIDHPRVSDLALHLVSPDGTRLLLAENRGRNSPDGFGVSITNLLVSPRTSSGGPEEDVNEIETGSTWGTIKIDYEFFPIPDTMHIYYDGESIYDSGLISGGGSFSLPFGPGLSTKVTIIINEGGSSKPSTRWNYTATIVAERIYYTVFTENTNKTTVPIKFAPTPFTPAIGTQVLFSGFEGLDPGDYGVGSGVDGWTVISNFVSVINGQAYGGTNYLAAIDAAVWRLLPTRAGSTYTLQFASRAEVQGVFSTGVDDTRSLLPGGAVDPHYRLVSGGRFPAGPAGRETYVVQANALPSYWLPNTASSKWIAPVASGLNGIGAGSFIYRTTFNLAGYDLPTVRVVGRLAVDYEVTDLVLNGQGAGVNYVGTDAYSPPFTIAAGFLPGHNLLDFVCTNRAGAQGLRTELGLVGDLRPGLSNTPPVLILGGLGTNQIADGLRWGTNAVRFVAPADNTPVTVVGGWPGVRLDNFSLSVSGDSYYLPEEPLKPMLGESAFGVWRLEITDRRVNATNPPPTLVNWRLSLMLAETNPPALHLAHGQCYDGTIPPGEVRHFLVDVPRAATLATNTFLRNGDLTLYFNQSRYTSSGGPGDVQLLPPGDDYVLITNGVPPLLPGQSYYLGVTSRETTTTRDFTLCVNFDRTDYQLLVVPALTNDVLVTNLIQPGAVMDYYQFTISANAQAATFELLPVDGNVDLYVRKAQPGPDPLPSPSNYDFASVNPGLNLDRVVITADDTPPLSAGPWYVGVLNREIFPVAYSLRATEFAVNTNITIIQLTNNVPVDHAITTVPLLTNFFLFTVDQTNAAVQFDLYNLTGPAELALDFNKRPTTHEFYQLDPCSPLAPAKVVLRTNDALPSLNGDWFLTVINRDTNNLAYTVMASFPVEPRPVLPLASRVWFTNTIPADTPGLPAVLDYYQFTVAPTCLAAQFELEPVDGNVELLLRKDGLPDLAAWDIFSGNPNLQPEVIRLGVGDPTMLLTPGDWFLAVYNYNWVPVSVTYRIRAADLTPNIVPLVSNSAVTNTIPNGSSLDYYSFDVSDRATDAVFELLDPSGPAGLLIRYGLPLPDAGWFDYSVASTGLLSTSVTISASSPIPLAQGRWYVAVTNLDVVPVSYAIRATECMGQCEVDLKFTPLPNGFALDWFGPAGRNFQVQYATNIPPNWVTLPNIITSTGSRYRFVDDGTQTGGPARFKMYRVLLVP